MQTYNFPDHVRGDTCPAKNFTISVHSLALDLTGATIRMDVRKNGERYLRLKTSPGIGEGSISLVTAAEGKFRIDEQVIDIPGNTYVYDIEITLASGKKDTYVGGSWKIIEDVTHDR